MPEKPEPVINSCPSCGDPIDVSALMPYAKIQCPHCDEAVRIRTHLGKYSIIGRLGEGGMSQVFRAEDTALSRQVALKILHQELSEDDKLTALFEREAQLTASINHPNVVKVFTVGREGAYFFIAMELVDNISLEKVLEKDGALTESESLDLLYDVTKGLRAAFQTGLIHRDIKPGNMLMTKEGIGKLVDFGLAIIQDDEDEMEDLWATPFYVPPEKLDGKPDDFRGDIYSLGATFFHALAGKPPFAANTSSIEQLKLMKRERVSLADYAPNVSKPLVDLVDRMMSYEPIKRPQSYDELLELIGEVQEECGEVSGQAARDRRENASTLAEGAPPIAKWGGVAALLLIGIVSAVVFLTGDPGGDSTDGFDFGSDGGDRVLAAGETNAAARYLAARDLLQKGSYVKAEKEFAKLIKSDDLRQPTLAWTQFHVGLSSLLGGREKPARADFAPLSNTDGFEESQTELRDFFRKIGGPLTAPLPVTAESVAQLDQATYEVLGLFVYGLKNWQLEQFESGAELLKAFRKAEVPDRYAWIRDYQKQVGPFLDDAKLLKSLPNPTNQSPPELKKLLDQLKPAAEEFETRGAAPSLARRRLKRAGDLLLASKQIAQDDAKIDSPAPPATEEAMPETAQPKEAMPGLPPNIPQDARVEVTELTAFSAALRDSASPFNLSEMVTAWSEMTAETTAGKRLRADEELAWDSAERFYQRALTKLEEGTWEGEIPQINGETFNARVANYTEEGIALDFGFGENDPADFPLDQIDASFFYNVLADDLGTSNLDPIPFSEAAYFSRQIGRDAEASYYAERTIALLPSFSNRWERLNPPAE